MDRCSKINQFYCILGLKSDANFIKVRSLVTPSTPTEFLGLTLCLTDCLKRAKSQACYRMYL